MNKKQWEERQQTIDKFRELTNIGAGLDGLVDRLHRYETTLHRISEIQCSVELTEEAEKELEQREEDTENKVKKIAEELGFKVRFNGDPRGGAIRFILPDKSSNGWDRETWGIYW
jgi:hypothetical protein